MDMSCHPSAHGSQSTEAPASAGAEATPNLPALITALPGDHARAPQTEFDRARQVLFLENLSVTGSVRSAAASAQVSHQSAYRARRACGAFRTAWDAALVVARAAAADTLAARAIDGVTEPVFYHGEEVGTRTRYSDRLLLAHLARLDRLVDDPRANAFAEDFDAALAGFGRGEEFVAPVGSDSSTEVPASAGAQGDYRHRSPAQAGVSGGPHDGGFSSPGRCNTRSKSYSCPPLGDPDDWDEYDADEDDDNIDWEDEEAAEAELARIEAAMAAERPADAPRLTGDDEEGRAVDPHGLNADAQWQAYDRGVPRWWLVIAPAPDMDSDDWCYADLEDEDSSRAGAGEGGCGEE